MKQLQFCFSEIVIIIPVLPASQSYCQIVHEQMQMCFQDVITVVVVDINNNTWL